MKETSEKKEDKLSRICLGSWKRKHNQERRLIKNLKLLGFMLRKYMLQIQINLREIKQAALTSYC